MPDTANLPEYADIDSDHRSRKGHRSRSKVRRLSSVFLSRAATMFACVCLCAASWLSTCIALSICLCLSGNHYQPPVFYVLSIFVLSLYTPLSPVSMFVQFSFTHFFPLSFHPHHIPLPTPPPSLSFICLSFSDHPPLFTPNSQTPGITMWIWSADPQVSASACGGAVSTTWASMCWASWRGGQPHAARRYRSVSGHTHTPDTHT